MFTRFSRSWSLTKQSFAVLSSNPVLMIFPCLSALATLIVIASFLVPLFSSGAYQSMAQQRLQDPAFYLGLLAFYFCCYFVQTFFTCALMASANVVICGGRASLKEGLGLAAARIGNIAAWALMAATVGVILRTLQERLGIFGKIVIAMTGGIWSILTYFIAPVIIFEDLSVFDGVRRSAQLVKKTWGEGIAGGVTFVALNWLAAATLLLTGIIFFMAQPILGLVWVIGYIALWAIVASTASAIFRVALYRYAWIGAKTDLFDQNLIENAFKQRNQ